MSNWHHAKDQQNKINDDRNNYSFISEASKFKI
jgi:hypothetical protein